MIYQSVLGAVVSALAAEAIDTTSKQAWQKLYNSADEGEGGDLATLFGARSGGKADRTQADCWVSARLHHRLKPQYWNALLAHYSTHKGKKVQAIAALQAVVNTPAPKLFLYKAITAWAVPQLKGARLPVARSVSLEVPLDAPDWRQAAMVKAAVAAGKANTKKCEARSADMIVLKDSFYDMNTWDLDARPERTRREWRQNINAALDKLVSEALIDAGQILRDEGVLLDEAA